MSTKRVPSLVDTLTAIWQRVLQRSSIGVDDNFFGVGGTLRSADLLFAEIARLCGRELPSATIYHAQTIAALARLLEEPTVPNFSPLIQLKTGNEQPPILIVHGLAGTVPFFGLARHIQTGHPVYGILAKGVDGMEEPLDSIADMASFYLDSLKDLQPHGPYILIGYSFGGLVALEMAQRMAQCGEKVALLAMVDAYPHLRYLSAGQRVWLIAQRAIRGIAGWKQVKQRSTRILYYVAQKFESVRYIAGVRNRSNRLPEPFRLSFEQATLRVKAKAYVALDRYRPRFYQGKIKFVKSETDSYFPADPRAVWVNLASEFEVKTVPGGHLDMITTEFENLAAVLTGYVKEAFGQE